MIVRAVAASTIPINSAIGYEADTTLIDHAADERAPMPTVAGERAMPLAASVAPGAKLTLDFGDGTVSVASDAPQKQGSLF